MFKRNCICITLALSLASAVGSAFGKGVNPVTGCRVPAPAAVLIQGPDEAKDRAFLYKPTLSIWKEWNGSSIVQDVTCSFTLSKNGVVLNPKIVKSGSSKLIDDMAIHLLRQSSPLEIDRISTGGLKVVVRFKRFPSLELSLTN